MFNDNQAIKRILKDLDDLIAYCIDCGNLTSDDNAWSLYIDTRCQLEHLQHGIETRDDDDDIDDDDDNDEVFKYGD